MAPKTRTKPNTRARMQRISTQFSELDVTPSRPGDKNQHPLLNEGERLPLSEANIDEHHLHNYEAGESVFDETQQDITTAASFAWSDAGSTNVTRRSSPMPPDDFPEEEFWDFDNEDDEVIKLFESGDSKNRNLPDTMPLGRESQAKEPSLTPGPQVDFSETASSIHRSSPYMTSDARKDLWDFSDSLSSSGSPVNTAKHNDQTEALRPAPSFTSHHLPMDDIYDATPRKTETPAQVQTAVEPKVTKSNVKKSKTVSIVQDSTATALHQKLELTNQPSSRASAKTKRRQQKAKEPIKFDPLTQEIIDIPKSKKKINPPLKLSIIGALQESAKESSSPFASVKKPSRKQAPKQKQRAKQAKKRKPEPEVVQRDAPDIVVLNSSPAQVAMDSPSASPQDLPCVHHDEQMKASQPICMQDDSVPIQAPKEHHYQTSLAAKELENGPESLLAEHMHIKRRKLSRQFSISEKGSPVVIRDAAPMNKIDPAVSEPDPFSTNHASLTVATQPPSFLRTTSGDKLYGQQQGSAVGGIDSKASPKWLRRVDEQKPGLKHHSTTARNIHDNIMKSFLGAAETLQGPQDLQLRASATTRDRSQINKQIYHIADYLVKHLDSKKAAAFKLAEVYHTSGVASMGHLKRQCLQDCGSVVTAFRQYNAMFNENLQAAKDALKARQLSRARQIMELGEARRARHQEYSKVRLNLGAIL